MTSGKIWLGGPLAFLLAISSGCFNRSQGPPRLEARGTVTLDGQPLPEGVIRFVPVGQTEGPKASTVIEQGRFDFPPRYGPVAGRHRIEVDVAENAPPDPDDQEAVRAYLEARGNRKPAASIPAVYNRHSLLEEEVTAEGPNEFRFELLSRP